MKHHRMGAAGRGAGPLHSALALPLHPAAAPALVIPSSAVFPLSGGALRRAREGASLPTSASPFMPSPPLAKQSGAHERPQALLGDRSGPPRQPASHVLAKLSPAAASQVSSAQGPSSSSLAAPSSGPGSFPDLWTSSPPLLTSLRPPFRSALESQWDQLSATSTTALQQPSKAAQGGAAHTGSFKTNPGEASHRPAIMSLGAGPVLIQQARTDGAWMDESANGLLDGGGGQQSLVCPIARQRPLPRRPSFI